MRNFFPKNEESEEFITNALVMPFLAGPLINYVPGSNLSGKDFVNIVCKVNREERKRKKITGTTIVIYDIVIHQDLKLNEMIGQMN